MTLDTSDRKSVRAAEKAAARTDRERGEVVTALMATQPGRKYVWDKLGEAGIFHSVFSTEPLQMAFNEGQRNQGLLLLNEVIQWCPEQFIQAMREANGRRTSDAGQQRAGSNGNGRDQGSTGEPNLDPDFDNEGRWIGEGEDPRSNPAD